MLYGTGGQSVSAAHRRGFDRLLSSMGGWTIAILLLTGCGFQERRADGDTVEREQSARALRNPGGKSLGEDLKTALVFMRERADLSVARATRDAGAKGQAVYDDLTTTAARSQAGLLAFLKENEISHQPFWIVNAVRVTTDATTWAEIEHRPDIDHIVPDEGFAVPRPKRNAPQADYSRTAFAGAQADARTASALGEAEAQTQAALATVDWNLEAIRAPEVWAEYGVLGEGIVVANIGSGADFDHPALVQQYRGILANGGFDHDYNWFDPLSYCSEFPCELHLGIPPNGWASDGTPSLGIMVGDDHAGNRIGVAPRASWIATNVCSPEYCFLSSVIQGAEWVLAPRDISEQNPRPDLRPHVVNVTAEGFIVGGSSPLPITDLYPIIDAWVAAGIFPVLSGGYGGYGEYCDTIRLGLGDYPGAYTVGAFDSKGSITSARGPSTFGDIKPNIAAPGSGVRSATPQPGLSYDSFYSPWTAASHVAGTVALLWSASPALRRDVAATRAILDRSAKDVADLSCGGTEAKNNIWGEGKLDALAAMRLTPLESRGTLLGIVTDTQDNPIVGARIQISGGEEPRETFTGSDGSYFLSLPVGSYELRATTFDYPPATIPNVTIEDGIVTTQNLRLEALARHSIKGTVRDEAGAPLRFATLTLVGTPIPSTRTASDGSYSFPSVPEGAYDLRVDGGGCYEASLVQAIALHRDIEESFTLTEKVDGFGYRCRLVAPHGLTGDAPLPIDDEDGAAHLLLPFSFPFYGRTYGEVDVSMNGALSFTSELNASSYFGPYPIPSTSEPNGIISPYGSDLIDEFGGQVFTKVIGTAPERSLVIEWRGLAFIGEPEVPLSFSAILSEQGGIVFEYAKLGPGPWQSGEEASIGIENETGDSGFQYSYNQPVLTSGLAIEFLALSTGTVRGLVTDEDGGDPVPAATLEFITSDGDILRSVQTGDDGRYQVALPAGTLRVRLQRSGYFTQSAFITVTANQTVDQDFALESAFATVSPSPLELGAAKGDVRALPLTLKNTGSFPFKFSIHESGAEASHAGSPRDGADVPWLKVARAVGSLGPGRQTKLTVFIDTRELTHGRHAATIFIKADASRPWILEVPVSILVTDYLRAIDVGGRGYTGADGATWLADRRYTPRGGWGYLKEGFVLSTPWRITGTPEPALYRTQRVDPVAYRFDPVPSGSYEIQLSFAELRPFMTERRRFDVVIENTTVLTAHDIEDHVGNLTADDHTFLVDVTDGRLDVELVPVKGSRWPALNAIRIVRLSDR